MPRFLLLGVAVALCGSTTIVCAQDALIPNSRPNVFTPNAPVPARAAADGSFSDGVLTVSDIRLAWEPFADFPTAREDFRFRAMPKPPFALTLTAHLNADIPNRRGPRTATYPGRVFLLTPGGGRISGTALRNFVGGEGVYKWVWNEASMPDPRSQGFEFAFDYSTAARSGTPAEKEGLEWADIPVDGVAGAETSLGAAKTEKVTPSGVQMWLESVLVREAKARPNAEAPAPSVKVFGRWLPPADDPAMRVIPELARAMGEASSAFSFDNGEAPGRASLALGREVDRADETPGWFTLSAPRSEGARTARVRLSLQTTSPLKTDSELRSLRVSLPAVALPAAKTDTLFAPIAQQPLGKGQLQLFAPVLSAANGSKWSWQAPLFLQMPPGADDGSQWIDTDVTYRAEGEGAVSTGLSSNIPWKLNGTPLQNGEVARQVVYAWPEREGATPPTKVEIETTWNRLKTDVFTPRFDQLAIPTIGKPRTPNLVQPLGVWGTLVLRKVATFGPNDDLGPRFKGRSEKFFPVGGLALVFEHIPAAGKSSEPWDLENNYPTWSIGLGQARDDQNYPLRRVTDAPDGRHLPPSDELSTEQAPQARYLTLYLLPPTPAAKTLSVSLDVKHQVNLDTQTVTFAGVALPQ